MDTKILELLEEYFDEEFVLVQHDVAALEQLVKEKMQLLGQGLFQRAVNRQPNGYKGSSITCKCGGLMRFVRHRCRDIHTLFGWINVKRAYYHCPDCGRRLFPYDVAGGLGSEQISPQPAKACCLLAVDDSFEQTSRKIDKVFGQKVSANTIERLSDLIRHISSNEEQMRYDVFREKGYDIGSGAVGGACKYVVGKRLKQSGMIWTRRGSSSILALRIPWLNKKWDQLWENKPLAA